MNVHLPGARPAGKGRGFSGQSDAIHADVRFEALWFELPETTRMELRRELRAAADSFPAMSPAVAALIGPAVTSTPLPAEVAEAGE